MSLLRLKAAAREEAREASEHGAAGLKLVLLWVLDLWAGRGPGGAVVGMPRTGAVVGMPRTGAVAVVGLCQTAEGTVVITVMRMVGFETI